MKKLNLITSIVMTGTLLLAGQVSAKGKMYEEAKVDNGGTITGTVMLKGKVPPPIMEDLTKGKNSDFCRQHPDTQKDGIRPRHKVMAKDGKLSGTVVFIENIDKGKAWSEEGTNFDFRNCDIFPKVTVVRKTTKGMKEGNVRITNHDADTLHNPHGYSVKGANRKTLFNKPLPSQGDVADVTKNVKRLKKKKDSHFFLQCDQHNFMEADARIIWNPYYSVTGEDGSYKLDQIPPGKYKVSAWHPYIGETSQEITVSAGGASNTDFELTVK